MQKILKRKKIKIEFRREANTGTRTISYLIDTDGFAIKLNHVKHLDGLQ